MNLTVDMQIACEHDDHPPPSKIEQWVEAALSHCPPMPLRHQDKNDTEITIRIVDEQESCELNRNYRGKDQSTNVLSFPAEIPEPVVLPLLGDLVICSAVVNREAQQQHKHQEHHWAHMVIHGCLHLLGYDHIENEEAAQMEALEIEVLATLNIANPYLEQEAPTNQTVNL